MTMYERLRKATKKETLDFLTDFILNIAEILIGLPRHQVLKTLRMSLTEEQWTPEEIECFFDPTLETSVVYTPVTEQTKGVSKDMWIKFPEERPRKEDYFLVVVENAVMFPNVTYGYYSKKDDTFKCVEDWKVLPVTYWKALPEPPKED